MVDHVECIVAGAGAIGLAIARTFAQSGRQVMVLEALDAIGTLTSSRNSEVVHAGLYYEPGSQKANTCVSGRRMLYDYMESRNIGFKRLTKLIVAQSQDELERIEALKDRGTQNGVEGLKLLTRSQALVLEPDLHCLGALLSEETGIFDSHEYMQALVADMEDYGGMVVLHAPILSGIAQTDSVVLNIGGLDPTTIKTDLFINAAGNAAPALSRSIEGFPSKTIPTSRYCKGNYFTMPGKSPFSRLIYPAPATHGLGVHLTLDLGGQARFGPDTEWIDELNYDVSPQRVDQFYAEIRKYWPGLPDGSLQPGYAGIRPKIEVEGELYTDFLIRTPNDHGVPMVALYGIESPGLTASLAIAEQISVMIS